ncbi:hypothetical protein ASC97_05660 [Rhizobium sp. Root1203]|uniref:PLxRFG domain-containing protein n=1 Tax=Rhizobium sp. Root1203 TaxID=1736427 RepID=UPI00070A73E7|nr:PLxRFG domain-containing protein [Rhizobium sp. Root1203]KQV27850.1 hypothetical protein ASC97_05660 [Rhizobium sp. Root1203]
MPLVIGLGKDDSWKDPLNLYGGKAPAPASSSPDLPKSTPNMRDAPARPSFNDQDRNDLVNTIIAEAAGEGDSGMTAVAAVIRNRANERGLSPADVVRQKSQFTGYEHPGPDAVKAQQDPALRQRAEAILDGVLSGSISDPTGGADHYHADSVNPDWASKMPQTTKLGRHVFYKSGQQRADSTATAYAPGLSASYDDPFEAVLNPTKDQKQQPAAGDTTALLSKLQPGRPAEYINNMKPGLQSGLTAMFSEAPDFVKNGLDILSGARSPERQAQIIAENSGKYGIDREAWLSDVSAMGPVAAGEKWRPIFRETGMSKNIGRPGGSRHQHGDAADLGWAGKEFSNAPKEVRDWVHANAGKYGLTFPMGHEPWHVETTDARSGRDDTAGGELRPFRPGETRPNTDGTYSTEISTTWQLPDGKWVNVPSLWMGKNGPQQFKADDEDSILGSMKRYEQKNGQVFARFDSEKDAVAAAEKRSAAGGAAAGNTIAADAGFQVKDPMGLYPEGNPIQKTVSAQIAQQDERQTATNAQFEQNRMRAFTEQHNDAVGARQQQLEAENPDRYISIDEAELPNWQKQWETENRSGGVGGDTARILKSGTIGIGQSLSSLADTLFRKLPGGDAFLKASDDIDRWAMGKPIDQKMNDAQERANASVTERQGEADQKKWWDSEKHTFGPAWRDPRSYLRTVGESAPSTVITMLPGGILARGAYLRAIASGLGERVAAASAARTATLAGAITEGTMGGADSARNVRDRIGKIPRDQLAQSDAIKAMVQGGMSQDEAIKALTEDAASQAFLTAGVATGMFGGMGDRALAKIIAEGVGGGVMRRIVGGATRGFVGEGLLEEAPQGAAQTIAENAAVQRADPGQSLTEGVGEAVASGVAAGGAMGAGMGGAGGAFRPASPEHSTAAAEAVPAATRDPVPQPSGPIGRAVQHAETQIRSRADRAASDIAREQGGSSDGRPSIGATVRVDHDGIEPFMARVDSYEGEEAVLIDSGSGEIYQVPATSISQIAKSPEAINRENPIEKGPVPINDQIPEFSNDPALKPQAPIAGEIKSEPLPSRSEQQPAMERLRGRPSPGQRVIVDDPNGGRFAAKVESYEEGNKEALVVNDDGEPLQVPVDRLYTDKLTPKQIEKQELDRNPAIEREVGDAGPNSRAVIGRTVVMPDENHAALFDLGKARFIAKKLGRSAHTDLERVGADELARLAEAFKVSKTAVISMADDYRYRVDKAARDANSKLPVKMHSVNDKRLRQWQNDRAKEEPGYEARADDMAHWWDIELTGPERTKMLADAGVKRNERVQWSAHSKAIQKKLEELRNASTVDKTDESEVDSEVDDMEARKAEWLSRQSVASIHKDMAKRVSPSDFARRVAESTNGQESAIIEPGGKLLVLNATSNPNGDHAEFFGRLAEIDAPTDGYVRISSFGKQIGADAQGKISDAAAATLQAVRTSATREGLNYLREAGNAAVTVDEAAGTESQNGDTSTRSTDSEGVKAAKEAIEKLRAAAPELADSIKVEVVESDHPALRNARVAVEAGADVTATATAQGGTIRITKDTPPDVVAHEIRHVADALIGGYAVRFGLDDAEKSTPDQYRRLVAYLKEARKAGKIPNDVYFTDNAEVANAVIAAYYHDRAGLENAAPSYVDLIDENGGERFTSAIAPTAPVTVDEAAHEAATSPNNDLPEPTQAQKEAGNYKVGRISLGGLEISIENPAGSERKGADASGKPWSVEMKSHYGYIRGTVGKDKDHIDVFVRQGTNELGDSAKVFVIDQRRANGRFDEHKVMLGFDSEESARAAYLENYMKDWKGLGDISSTTLAGFKDWLKSGKTSEPFAPVKRFEVRETTRGEPKTAIVQDGITATQVREVFRSKEFKTAYADIAATQMGTPHPESPVAYDIARGWMDQKAGSPPTKQKASSFDASGHGINPIEPYYMGYAAARDGKARVIRASQAEAAYAELSGGNPKPPTDAPTAKTAPAPQEHAQSRPPQTVAADAPGIDLWRGASKAEIEEIKAGTFEFRPTHLGIMFTTDRDTATGFGNQRDSDTLSIKIPTTAKVLDRKELRNRSAEFTDVLNASVNRPGFNMDEREAFIRAEARDRGYDVVTYASGTGAYQVYEIINPDIIQIVDPTAPATKAKPPVSENKIFTASAAEKARELLRRKFRGQLNSGVDPELLQAGITLAGYHIERGARTFAAYASAMIEDLGESARPYLKSWYMGVKYDPRAAVFDGMSSAAEVDTIDVASIAGENNESAELDRDGSPALEGTPSEPVPGAESSRDAGSGAERRSRADVPRNESARGERVQSGRGVADEQGELSLAAGRRGGEPGSEAVDDTRDGKGRGKRSADDGHLEQGPFGPILRGYEGKWREAALELERRQSGDAIGALSHPDVGPIDLVWGNAGTNQGNGAGLAKLLAWHPEVLGDLQGFIDRLHIDKDRSTARRIQLSDDGGNAGVRLDYDGTAKTWLLTAFENGSRRSEKSSRRLSALWGDRSASTPPRTEENISDRLRDVQSAAVPAQQRAVDYTISDSDNLGEGGQKAKFNANVAAIKLLRKLDEEKRPATRDEQSVLAQWVGWGGLRQAFAREGGSVAKGWEKQADELKSLLSPEEYSAAESSTRNAHYTAPEVVSAVWDIARKLGFKGGQVLEPSVGAGNFLGLMPGEVKTEAKVTGVELDRVTGGIAKNLYPSANIQAPVGFEKLVVPDGYFDLAIGNPPFGSEKVYDKERRHLNKLSVHNFFFAKSVEALRPGGVLAMVVTNRFLDGSNATAREMIAKQADLIGAIRLPNDAFLKNAGTEVTTDIVLLRKRMPGEEPKGNWTDVGEWKGTDGKSVPLNRYFIDHPDMMLGDFGAFGTMYGPDEPALVARKGQSLPNELAKAIRTLPDNVMVEPGKVSTETVVVPETVSDVQVGAMFAAPDGTIHQRQSDSIGQAQSQPVVFPNDTARERVSGMVRVRDAFARLRRAQIDESTGDQQIENLRKRLNTVYDGFVKKHGPINADANKRLFRDDPTWPQISALEQNFDKGISSGVAKTTGEVARPAAADKAPIFTKRTQQPYRRPTSASSAKDALATVLNDLGRVDLVAMSRLYGKPSSAMVDELGPLLYRTPSGSYETSDAYLSGNVKQKLAEAERAAQTDPDFRRNVNALRDVQPADIEAIDIDVKPGAPWVPAKHIVDFLRHIGQGSVKPKAYYSAANAKWVIDVPSPTAAAQTLWGTDRASVDSILSAVLNGQAITISDRMSDGSTVLNQAKTDAANEKAERVKAEWRRWVWDEDARRDELTRLYNDTFNTDIMRTFDGSHLTLPGKVGDDIISFRPHQKNFVWRSLQSGTALADHTVGAGKTFAAIASAMEKRRIGQARKPMFAVPNHLVGQWAADFVRLYPGAKVLAATKRDFEKDNRKRLFARVATGDWDAVIVAHSSFGKIGMDPNYESRFIQQQMDDLEASIAELRQNTGEKSRNVAQLTKWRDSLKAKMERLLDAGKKDDGLTFDELGVDALYVDEAHEFKNLAFATSMNRVAGLGNQAGSQKASDLFMKSRFILEKTGGNNVTFLSGTPLSNTMAEMYTVQRYLDEKTLRNLGVAHFDAWAKVFGEVVTDWELSPSGQYKLNSRFAKFVNMPELMQRYLSFADVITNDDIKAQLAAIGKKLPLPKVKGGKPTNVTVERSRDQAAFIGEGKTDDLGNLEFPKGSLVWRAENLPKKAEKGADNMLKVMSDARKAALDMRLIDPAYGDHPGSKVHVAADNMKRIHDKWAGKRGTQLVFIDLSTPKKAKAREEAELRALIQKADQGDEAAQEKLDNMSPDDFLALQSTFSVYDDLREKLIDRGVSPDEIAFIHDANTEAQKEELFGKVRSGRVRILLGSTPKMGAGTNVQNRLVALHHLDAPWRPSDLEQRDGRGIRQGNELYSEDPDNFEIEILRYATKNTLDARQWQGIEAKARFIQQVRKGNLKTREIEDIAGEATNAAEMKAAASGNPLILEEMETRRKLRQLEGQSVEHDREQHRIKGKIRALTQEADELEARSGAVNTDAARSEALANTPFEATIGDETFDKPKEFGAAIAAAMRKELIDRTGEADIGKYGEFLLSIELQYDRAFEVTVSGKRDYHVHVQDAADVDATGLGMRVINTVKKLSTLPEQDRERIAEAKGQIPALEKQIGPWGNAGELQETSERHRRILDALKPKQKSAGAAAVAKRPDPVIRGDGRFKEVPVPTKAADETYADWARRIIMDHGKLTGHEYLVAIDDDGSTIDFGTANDARYTGMSNKLASAMSNPDRRLVLYHNHPAATPLSAPDLASLVYPGVHAIYALGHNGYDTAGSLTPIARQYLSTSANFARDSATMLNSMAALSHEVEPFIQSQLKSQKIDEGTARDAFHHFAALVMQRAGIIDFSASKPYDVSVVPGLDRKIDEAALKLTRAFFKNGKPDTSSAGADRSSNAVRHLADMEGLGKLDQQVASPRSGPTGLSERSAPNDPEKVSGGKRVTEARVVQELNGKLVDLQPKLLKTIPLNYFTELARPNMTAVGDYLRVKRLMDAYRGTKHAAADAIAGDWLKYARLGFLGKDKSRAQQLADLMHDSTLAGADPSKTDEENVAKPGYAILRKQYLALPEKGRELYSKVRDAYREQATELDEILLDNVRKAQQIAHNRAEERYRKTMQAIRDSGLTGLDRKKAEEDASSAHKAETTKATWAAKARLTKMRIAFESSRVEAPYFPLGRFGRYFVTVRDIDGRMISFSKHETAAARNRVADEMRRTYSSGKVEVGVMEAGSDLRKAMDPRIVAEIEEILGGAGVGNDVMDQIWQRYLESMPDLSARKRFIHRKGTSGFSNDALRVFSSHMFHAAHQIARLKYGLELQELVDQTMDQAKESDDQTRGVTLANEMSSRHDWVMNPTGSKVAQTMTSTAFVWFLAASPGAAIVNMTQTAMLGLPILSAKFGGFAKASSALAQASMDTVRGRGSIINGSLSKDEKVAIEAFYESGLIDRTQSHDLAGVGETGVEYTPLRARVMGVISWAFHRAEVWNREVTALAAYRMARDAGQSMSDAIDTAHDLTWKTHFDYANSSRPTLLQNDIAKVTLVFRQHNINMLYRLFRDIHQSVKGETPQARKEARYQLAGVVGMMSLMAGVTGTVGFHLAMALAGMVFGDDDDPMDFEQQFRANVVDVLGPELGGVLLNGVPGHYLGVDLSSRIGMPDLWFRSPTRELQGKDEYQYWLTQALGATAGLGETLFTGANLVWDGDVARGIEMMAPKAVRDLMKSYRYATDGLATVGGDEIMAADQISYHDIIAQALGFTPARISETWDRNTSLKNAERGVMDDRQRLVNKFAMAALAKDDDAIDDSVKAIERFNAVPVHGGIPITKETLQQSLKTRAGNAAKREDGVLIRNKILSLRLREKLADPVYK